MFLQMFITGIYSDTAVWINMTRERHSQFWPPLFRNVSSSTGILLSDLRCNRTVYEFLASFNDLLHIMDYDLQQKWYVRSPVTKGCQQVR